MCKASGRLAGAQHRRRAVTVAGTSGRSEPVADESARLAMPIGEAIYTQRSIRRLRPDPIPGEDLRLILEAATKAPNGGNAQPTRFLVLTDPAIIKEFGALYREAWWA